MILKSHLSQQPTVEVLLEQWSALHRKGLVTPQLRRVSPHSVPASETLSTVHRELPFLAPPLSQTGSNAKGTPAIIALQIAVIADSLFAKGNERFAAALGDEDDEDEDLDDEDDDLEDDDEVDLDDDEEDEDEDEEFDDEDELDDDEDLDGEDEGEDDE